MAMAAHDTATSNTIQPASSSTCTQIDNFCMLASSFPASCLGPVQNDPTLGDGVDGMVYAVTQVANLRIKNL